MASLLSTTINSVLTLTSEITLKKNNARNLEVQGAGAGSADCGIVGKGPGGEFAFQIYGNNNAEYGFLNGTWASWDIRKVPNGNLFLNNNNAYYLNPASTTYLSSLTVANTISGSINGNAATSSNVTISNLNTQQVTISLAAGAWYTIAANDSNRASAKFTITDTSSGLHQAIHFYATAHYGQLTGAKITVASNTYYGGPPVSAIRIMTGGTYDGAMVQIYALSACYLVINLYDNQQSSGWVIKSGVVSTTNPGTVAAFANLTTIAASADLTAGKSFSVSDELYIGSATTQYKALHAGNYNSYSPTLTGGGASGNWSINATNVTGVVAIANGGTGASSAAGARGNLGATTVGSNFFTLTNPNGVTFPRINADNTVSTLDAATFRSAIGAGTGNGTVTSVGGTGTVSGLTLTGTVTTTGNLTLGGTLSVTPSNFASQTANTFLAAPNGAAGTPTFRAIVAADIPTLNQNTTGNAGSVTNGVYTNVDNIVSGTIRIDNINNSYINTVANANRSLTLYQATAGADAYLTFHVGGDYAAYLGLGGAENDLVYGGWSVGNARYRILHSGNQSFAWNLNQNLRTSDSPTFAELTLSGIGTGVYNHLKYGGIRTGDWQSFTSSAGQINIVQVENIAAGSHSNYPTGVYTYGGVMSWRLANHSFQLYAAHTGALAYKTQWNNDNYSGWVRILESTNYPHAANMNQYVRTTDSPTFADLSITGAYQIRNASPTIVLRDTDHRTGYIHVNSNIFYVLTGAADSGNGGWGIVANSRWPLEINLSNNNATFGGDVNAISFTGAGTGLTGTATNLSIGGNAVTAGGLAVHTGRNNEVNKIVRTDSNGYIQAGWINTTSGDNGTTVIDRVYASSDAYIRYYTPANFRTVLDVPTRAGSGASGNWAINITGNAATATTATNVTIPNGSITLAKIENITAYTILGNSNVSSAATPAALSVATVASMLSGQTMNINGSAATANALNTGNAYTIAGLTSNGQISVVPALSGGYSSFFKLSYDNIATADYTIRRNATTGFLEFDGNQAGYVGFVFNSGVVYSGTSGTSAGAYYFNSTGHGVRRISGTNDVYLFTTSGNLYLGTTGNTSQQIIINNSGNLGVGTSPSSYKLDVNGSCHATSFPASSDARFKKNIKPLENCVDKVKKMQGVSYEWNDFINHRRDGYSLNTAVLGVIAQDLEKILPEVVSKWHLSDDCKDARAVDYIRIIPVLIEAIKEQQIELDDLKNRLIRLENK